MSMSDRSVLAEPCPVFVCVCVCSQVCKISGSYSMYDCLEMPRAFGPDPTLHARGKNV